MPSLKEIKGRIGSVNSTLKITSAMKLVASAKLRKAQTAITNMLPYQRQLNEILADLSGGIKAEVGSEYSTIREVHKVTVVSFSSNSSLCGGFNANVIRRTNERIAEYKANGLKTEDITVYSVGRKVYDAMRKAGYPSPDRFDSLSAHPSFAEASALADRLVSAYLSGETDWIELIYNHFKSTASQPTVSETYLPLTLSDSSVATDEKYFIMEPGREDLLRILLPKVLPLKIYTVLLDSAAAEHAARTVAMQTATDNGNDLLAELTLQYNKGRQQKITNEILDLVGGSQE